MNGSCCPSVAEPDPRPCTTCTARGVPVQLQTVKALLIEVALRRVQLTHYRFCPNQGCETVYCNRGRATWKSAAAGELALGRMALTRAMCPLPSLHDRFVKDLPYVRPYAFKDGHLFVSLKADGGIYEFEPRPNDTRSPGDPAATQGPSFDCTRAERR